MFGTLSFPNSKTNVSRNNMFKKGLSKCILCELKFDLFLQEQDFLKHLFEEHHLVIGDSHLIGCLDKYVEYWGMRFKNTTLQEVCTTILVDIEKDGVSQPNQEYFLLSDVLPEDKELRDGLQQQRLVWALEQQKFEREDKTFSRECLFCHTIIGNSRAQYLNHLASHHNLQLGHPHNLVFIDDLINKLQDKIARLQCFYCEKVFRDKSVLKEHMRKKLWHKRINPENKEYDRFYMVNYLEPGKCWKEQQGPEREVMGLNEDCEWSDWTEDTGDAIMCLFCTHPSTSWENVSSHLRDEHRFNYEQLTAELNFYQQVKLVNYIRRQVYRHCCITCDERLDSNESLVRHMEQSGHLTLPAASLWDQPEYYFPTYDNDLFLCQIEDYKDTEEEQLQEKKVSSHLLEHKETIEKIKKLLID